MTKTLRNIGLAGLTAATLLLAAAFLPALQSHAAETDQITLTAVNGKTVTDYLSADTTSGYHAANLIIPSDGLLTVTVNPLDDPTTSSDESNYGVNLRILNAARSKDYLYSYSSTSSAYQYLYSGNSFISKNIGMKKGTYQLALGSYAKDFEIRLHFTKQPARGGSSQAKALTLKKGKTVKSTKFINGSTTQWFKITTTKRGKITVVVNGKSLNPLTSGSLRLTAYRKAGSKLSKLGTSSVLRGYSNKFYYVYGSSTEYTKRLARPGTYYLKVSQDKHLSGGYSVTYK